MNKIFYIFPYFIIVHYIIIFFFININIYNFCFIFINFSNISSILNLCFPSRFNFMDSIFVNSKHLAKLNVKATIVTYEWGEYLKRSENGEHQTVLLGWNGECGEDSVEAAWEQLMKLYADESGDDGRQAVVPVTYMNSAAALKAFCGRNGGIVCTGECRTLFPVNGNAGPSPPAYNARGSSTL